MCFFYSVSIFLEFGIEFQKWLLDEILIQHDFDCIIVSFVRHIVVFFDRTLDDQVFYVHVVFLISCVCHYLGLRRWICISFREEVCVDSVTIGPSYFEILDSGVAQNTAYRKISHAFAST